MADVKISGLPASTTPLDGTEVLPIVQGTTTKQVSVANLTAGRAISVTSVAQNNGMTTPYVIFQLGVPMVKISSGTMGNNGAISGFTALPFAYPNAYVYLPANAISAGSAAGWYFTVFSTTTAGVVYNNLWTINPSVSNATPSIPTSPVAFSTTGPGAYTGVTADVPVTGPIFNSTTVPFGNFSKFNTRVTTTSNNNANLKYTRLYTGGGAFVQWANTSAATVNPDFNIAFRGTPNNQFVSGASLVLSSAYPSVSIEPYFVISSTVATDNLIMEQVIITYSP